MVLTCNIGFATDDMEISFSGNITSAGAEGMEQTVDEIDSNKNKRAELSLSGSIVVTSVVFTCVLTISERNFEDARNITLTVYSEYIMYLLVVFRN